MNLVIPIETLGCTTVCPCTKLFLIIARVVGPVGHALGGHRAERLGELAGVVRAVAAADADETHVLGKGLAPELGHLVAIAGEGIQGGRERPVVGDAMAVRVS